jgi:hypothetical protein
MSAAEYLTHGWKLCDIPLGTKGPNTKGWELPSAVFHGGQGVGLCHAYSGTCSIDVDDYERAMEWLETKSIDLDALLADPRSVQIISGKINRAKLLYRLPTPLPSLSLAPYEMVSPKTGKMQKYHALEFRCGTRNGKTVQDVLPPTIHPETGKPYKWAYGDDLSGHWSILPELPSAIVALWQAELGPAPVEAAAPAAPKGADIAELSALLKQIDNSGGVPYEDWLKVGMALHHETGGSELGYQLWLSWSATSSKHDPSQMPAKWRSFHTDTANPVTLGALRREQVASPEQFQIVTAAADVGEDTRPQSIIRKLLESRLVFVTAQEMYYDLEARGNPWLSDRGIRHVFCPHMPAIKLEGKNGKPDKVVTPDPVTCLQNSSTKTVVDMVGMHPGQPRLYSEDGMKFVNFYIDEKVEDLVPLAPEKEALAFLWSRMKDENFRSWLMKFYAYALQHPGEKIQSAPLLVSATQGTGKNTLMKILPETLFGSRYVRSMSGSVLAGQFNGAIGQTWWLYLEELRAGVNKADRAHTTNKIKGWITDNTVEVHKKGLEAYDIRNRIQVTATTNFDDALQLDNNDRRWAIGEMLGPLSPAESLDLYGFLLSDRAPGVLRYIFRRVDTSGFKPTARAPETFAKKEMIVAGLGSWESKLVEAMVAGDQPFHHDVFRLKDVSDFMIGQGLSSHALGRLLRRPPFNAQSLLNGRNQRLWAWRNVAIWQEATEGQRLANMTNGTLLPGCSTKVPGPILAMSADAGVDSTLNLDLLG